MRKRYNFEPPSSDSPPTKKQATMHSPVADIKSHMILTDVLGKKWRLGKSIGTGGFGEIYLVSDNISKEVKNNTSYVAKIEAHTSGPLFVEVHCYLHIGKFGTINAWKELNGLQHLGMPHYVASGSHKVGGIKYRFLILPRFEKDLEQMFEAGKQKFNLKTVLTIALQTIDVLEYIHSKGYVHSDIKASNILFNTSKRSNTLLCNPLLKASLRYRGCTPFRMCKARKLQRTLRPNEFLYNFNQKLDSIVKGDRIYLLDYGLATKYLGSDGKHKPFCDDNRKAHAGTILFCSRDAHKGAQSRRSDLECLGYNLIYWLTSDLLWSKNVDPEIVHKKKLKCLENVEDFLGFSFNNECPTFLYDYFIYLQNLDFEEEPDYTYCKSLFKNALNEYGYKNNYILDFNNEEGWAHKQKRIKRNCENGNPKLAYLNIYRSPLKSNLPIKPILRKELKNKKLKCEMNWSKILIDPEVLIKKAKYRERKITDTSDFNTSNAILSLDINVLNPTSAMIEVFNKSMEKLNNSGNLSVRDQDWMHSIEGYTPAMMDIYNRKKQREIEENRQFLALISKSNKKSKVVQVNKNRKRSSSNKSVKSHSVSKKEVPKSNKPRIFRRIYRLRG